MIINFYFTFSFFFIFFFISQIEKGNFNKMEGDLCGYYLFKVQHQVDFGKGIYVFGSGQELGYWRRENAKRLESLGDNLWMLQVFLRKSYYEYQLFVSDYNSPNTQSFVAISNKEIINPCDVIPKNKCTSLLISDGKIENFEEQLPDFALGSALCEKYTSINCDKKLGFNKDLFYLISKGNKKVSFSKGDAMLYWVKVKKYENLLSKTSKSYYVIYISYPEEHESSESKGKIEGEIEDILSKEEVGEEGKEAAKNVIYISNKEEELKGFSSCKKDQRISSDTSFNVLYKVIGSYDLDFCTRYTEVRKSEQTCIYLTFTFN